MLEKLLNSDNWLQLGLGGAALFILFAFVILFMFSYVRSNNKNVANLCSKIDKLAETNTHTAEKLSAANVEMANKMSASNLEMAKSMTQVFTKSCADQENNKNVLNQINDGVNDIKASVEALSAKTETLLELKCRPLNCEKEQ